MNRSSKPAPADAADALLEAGRTQPVLSYDVELGLERHHHWLSSEAPLPEWASASVGTAAKPLVPVAIKTLVSIVVIGAFAMAVWQARGRPESSAAVRPSAPAPEPTPAAAPRVPDAPAPNAWLATTPIPVPDQSSADDQPIVAHRYKRATRSQRTYKQSTAVPATSAPAVPVSAPSVPVTETVETPTAPVESPASTATTEPRVARKARPVPGPQAQEPNDLAEMQQVAAAEKLLEQSPQRALALVRQGDQRFASGYFQQERAYIAIMALIRLGRIDEARAGAARFAKLFPALPYGVRIRSALEAQQSP